MIISYDKRYKKMFMNAFGLKVIDGYVVDKNTEKRIIDNAGGEVTEKRFSGIRKGSIEYISNDVVSLLKLHDSLVAKKEEG